MVGKEDASGSWDEFEEPANNPKRFWRSASWSSSRSMHRDPVSEARNMDVNVGGVGAQCRRVPLPLTPRSRGRAALPPLQPLSIARRSVEEWPRAGSDDIGEWGPLTPGGRDLNKGGERLQLDMSVIQKNSERSANLVRKDRIACFDKECSKVADHIYLGGEAVARDRSLLKENGITHVLNCVGFVCPEYFKTDFEYKTLWLQDKASEDITSILYDVFDYFEDVREQKGKVYVHCCQGVSRSTSLVIAYRMWREGQSFDDAFQFVKQARGIADPNMGFAWQLLQCQKRVHAFPLSPSSLLRVYRMAPHSPYDPMHLVPKILNTPSPSGLDSRGAFIIQVPSAIYIWIGNKCELIMERDARGAVSQIVRYEKVNAPVHVIKEGAEPSCFWDIFSEFLLDKSMNGGKHMAPSKIQPGERKVNTYDVDFEIFHKATLGGFVPPIASSEVEQETHLPARENSWSALRRKFASGHMKEFVSVPKLTANKVHSNPWPSDDRDNVGTKPANSTDSSSASSSSSSSSPPYLSPDSISSDSSSGSTRLSDSPLDSPSAYSETLSSFSNLSILPSKASDDASSHPGYIEVNFASQRTGKAFSPIKRSQLSIAQRRGSLSKFLKLPVADDVTKEDIRENEVANQQDDSIVFELGNQPGNLNYSSSTRIGGEKREGLAVSRQSASVSGSIDLKMKQGASTQEDSYILAGVKAGVLDNSDPLQLLVYSFPSLEKISVSAALKLGSESAFVFIDSEGSSRPGGKRNVYLWLGSSFTYDQHQHVTNTGTAIELVDLGSVGWNHWNQVGSDALVHIGLPRGTNIKIVKEGEEPADFLELLRMHKISSQGKNLCSSAS